MIRCISGQAKLEYVWLAKLLLVTAKLFASSRLSKPLTEMNSDLLSQQAIHTRP
jgi:hypothetical protein